MGWKTVEINTDDHIRLYLNNLLIKREGANITINLSDIDTLLLDNNRTNLSIRLINALMDSNINVVIFNNSHVPSAYLVPVVGNHMSLKVLEKQMQWTNIYKGQVWRELIRNKIANQEWLIKTEIGDITLAKELALFKNKVKDFDVTNREGHAAKIYWHALFGMKFIRDQKGFKYPFLNALLNYGYAILRGMVIKSIVKKGLDPRIALFHKSFTNFFALASDLMEPFRIIIDREVLKHYQKIIFTIDVKESLAKCLTKKVIINGKLEYINNAIDSCVDTLLTGNGWLWVDICA